MSAVLATPPVLDREAADVILPSVDHFHVAPAGTTLQELVGHNTNGRAQTAALFRDSTMPTFNAVTNVVRSLQTPNPAPGGAGAGEGEWLGIQTYLLPCVVRYCPCSIGPRLISWARLPITKIAYFSRLTLPLCSVHPFELQSAVRRRVALLCGTLLAPYAFAPIAIVRGRSACSP